MVHDTREVDLRSKLNGKTEPPGLPPGVLWRGTLADQLTTAAAHPVTVVSAGPGWGKTMAAASWAVSGAAHHPVAWLSLDDTDKNPRSFWSNLVTALVASGAVRDRSPLREHNPRDQFEAADLEELWVQLADLPSPVVLVIDDFQIITDGELLDQFGRLIAKLPPSPLRLVLLTRSDPVLPLQHLRARGDLTEIRAADLAFTPAETTKLFTERSLHLQTNQVGWIMDRAGGWPAGIQAAALTIDPDDADAGIRRFCAADRAAADYLIDDVLQAMTSADQDFLLKTSLTEMVNSELADQLTGRSDSRLVLEKLFNRGVFTVTRGSGWYSYQPMFRDLLTVILDAKIPPGATDSPTGIDGWTASAAAPKVHHDVSSTVRQREALGAGEKAARGPLDGEVHALRELVGRLAARFPDVPLNTVRQIVNASWDEFTGAPIRDFVPVLVERAARDRLRNGTSGQRRSLYVDDRKVRL